MAYKAKIETIKYWSDWIYKNTDCFSSALAKDLAYLWPAIANDDKIEVRKTSTLIKLLNNKNVSKDVVIWKYLEIT